MERRRPSHARHSDAQRTLLAAAALVASGAWASSAAAQTFVSLTFDDAIDDSVTDDVPVVPMDDVYQAARTLLTDEDELTLETSCPNVGGRDDAPRADERLDCDVPGTFYVNYPRLDERAYFTTAAIQDLDAWGHEIGGHSAHHLEIPKLESDSTSLLDLREQKLQVCWDRQRISALPKRSGVGTLDVTSFAYPFGEDHWAGSPALEARFGPTSPLLSGSETHNLVGRTYPGDCAYRNARDVGNGVNTPECTDRDPATPCQFAEFPTRLQNRFALVAPGSIHDLTPLDYPVVPPNDDGDGVYDRVEEYEARAHTIKGWIDNAIATRTPGDKNWVMLTFHTICFNQRCNSIGMEYHQFQELVTWLRQKRKAGDIEIKTVSQVLGDTRELKVVVPALAPPNTAVRNAQLGEDLNRDGFPDCFDSGGMGVYRSGVPIFTSTRADADENDNGLRDDGHGDRYYAYNVMAGGTTRGRFIVRLDLGQCSLSVVPGARYRAKFFYRRPALARTCNFADDPTAAPCPVPYAPAPPTGVAPQYSLIYAHRRPVSQTKSATEDGSWSTFTRVSLAAPNASWQAAQADILAPTGMNALSFGFEILHDQANGRVEVDVDDFSYCTLDPALDPTVPACAN